MNFSKVFDSDESSDIGLYFLQALGHSIWKWLIFSLYGKYSACYATVKCVRGVEWNWDDNIF